MAGAQKAKSKPRLDANQLAGLLTDTSIQALREIKRLHICSSADDVNAAVEAGAVLLAIATVHSTDDPDEEGFRFLIGLPRHVEPSQFLKHVFR